MVDLNNDGYKDIATVGYSAYVSVLLNNGNGTFAAKVDYLHGKAESSGAYMAVGDLNNDGYQDIITNKNSTSWAVAVFLNNGNGTFATKVDVGVGMVLTHVQIADVNNDNNNDILFSYGGTPGRIHISFGNGSGTTFTAGESYTVAGNAALFVVADVNSDNYKDIIVTSSSDMSKLINNGDGTFASATTYGLGLTIVTIYGTNSLVYADANGDGYKDVVLAISSPKSTVIVLPGTDNSGNFGAYIHFTIGSGLNSVAVGDFDNDSSNEIIATDPYNNTIIPMEFKDYRNGFAITNTSVLNPPVVHTWDTWVEQATKPSGTEIYYQFCVDDVATCNSSNTWQWWNGTAWANATNTSTERNTAAQLTSSVMRQLSTTNRKLAFKALLFGSVGVTPVLNSLQVTYTTDNTPPATNASNTLIQKSPSGIVVPNSSGSDKYWLASPTITVKWDPGEDNAGGLGMYGYCLYFGQSDTLQPEESSGY